MISCVNTQCLLILTCIVCVFAGETGAEVRGDAGRAQGLQRAAAGRRRDDEMGDVRRAGHHTVGALRLKFVDQ